MKSRISGRRRPRSLRPPILRLTVRVFRRVFGTTVVHWLLGGLARTGALEQILARLPARLLALGSLYWENPQPTLKRYRQLLDGSAQPKQSVKIAAALRLHGYLEEAQALTEAFPDAPKAGREHAKIMATRFTPSSAEFQRLLDDPASREFVPKGRRDGYMVQRVLPDHLHRRAGREPEAWDKLSPSEVCTRTLEAFEVLHAKRKLNPNDLIRYCLLLQQTLADDRTSSVHGFLSTRSKTFLHGMLGAEALGAVSEAASSGSEAALKAQLDSVEDWSVRALSYRQAVTLYSVALAFGLFGQALRIRNVIGAMAVEAEIPAPLVHSAWAQVLAGTGPTATTVRRLLRGPRSAIRVSDVADIAALARDRSLLEQCRADWRFPDERELRRQANRRLVVVHGPLDACKDLPVIEAENPFLILLNDYDAPRSISHLHTGLRVVTKELVTYRPESFQRLSGTPLRGTHTITSLGVSGFGVLKGWPYGGGNALQRAAALALRAGIGPIIVGGGTLFLASDSDTNYRRSVGSASSEGSQALIRRRALALPLHDPFFQFDYLRQGAEVGAFAVDSRLANILNGGIARYSEALELQLS